jgi:hypothetical protein
MEHTSLSDALISLIPTYGPWIIFGIVALESAGVPLPGETILVASALLAATTGQIGIVADARRQHLARHRRTFKPPRRGSASEQRFCQVS